MHYRKNILAMKTYAPPLSGRRGSHELLLDFNERTTPPPDFVLERLAAWSKSGECRLYPEYDGLMEAIASYAEEKTENIISGVGSDQLLDCIFRAVVDPGDTVVLPVPSFSMYKQCALLAEAKMVEYNLLEDHSCAGLRQALRSSKARLAVAGQPNNPTGGIYDPIELRKLAAEFPDTWFIADEAYFEFSRMTLLSRKSPLPRNLVVTRTLSKTFGLAGLRLGYAVASVEMIEQLLKIRGPYDVNQASVVAAMAALSCADEVTAYAREVMEAQKPRVEEALRRKGLAFLPSHANFLLLPEGKKRMEPPLKKLGIRCRSMTHPLLARAIRLGLGDRESTDRLIEAIERS